MGYCRLKMRWTIIFALCVAAASAKHMNDRYGHGGKNIELEQDGLSDEWNENEDMGDYEDEEYLHHGQSGGRHQGQQQQHKQRQQQHQQHKQRYPTDDEEDTLSLSVPLKHHQQGRRQQHHGQHKRPADQYKPTQRKQTFEDDEEEFGFDDQDDQEYQDSDMGQHQKRKYSPMDSDQGHECRPNYNLLKHLEQTNFQLATKLHKAAKDINDDKNTVVSPVALQLSLAAMKQGARGDTKREISQVLATGLPKNQEDNAHAALTRILRGQDPDETDSKSISIKCSTNIVLNQQSAQEQFVQSIKSCFDGEVKRCDFRSQPHQCRDQINQFVMGKTEQKLLEPLAKNAITGNTKMVSIGALQLKANWEKQFRRQLKNTEGRFYPLGEQHANNVKMLQTEGEFYYFEDQQMQVLGIQTSEKHLTLYVILPKERDGLSQLEKHRLQNGNHLHQLLAKCESRTRMVNVKLPMFQAVHKMDSRNMLRKLGVQHAFDADECDFTGIVDDQEQDPLLKYGRRQTGGLEDVTSKKSTRQHRQRLHFNKFIQQATIQINENGIDAANNQFQVLTQKQSKTVTEKEESKQTGQSQNQFHADHAFMFAVKHNPSGHLLLIGRVVDPMEKYE